MTLALDFDGVIHWYRHGWQGGKIYDQPMPGAREGVQACLDEDATFVFTARENLGEVAQWIIDNLGIQAIADSPVTSRHFWNKRGVLLVTNKKYPARAYLDDRAVTFAVRGGWAKALEDLELDISERVYPYLVTVKLPKNPEHNPRSKMAGPCPVNGEPCSDITGEHHTIVVRSTSLTMATLESQAKYGHVTRVESLPTNIPF